MNLAQDFGDDGNWKLYARLLPFLFIFLKN